MKSTNSTAASQQILLAFVDYDEVCKTRVACYYDLDFFVHSNDLFCDKCAAAKPASYIIVHRAHLHYLIWAFELYITSVYMCVTWSVIIWPAHHFQLSLNAMHFRVSSQNNCVILCLKQRYVD